MVFAQFKNDVNNGLDLTDINTLLKEMLNNSQ